MTALRLNALRLTPIAVAILALGLASGPVRALDLVPPGPSGPGGFLIHGNFCGPGSRGPGYPPIDALDLACAHHDACSPAFDSGSLPTCACNRTLWIESDRIARDPRTPARTRETAQVISGIAAALPCR